MRTRADDTSRRVFRDNVTMYQLRDIDGDLWNQVKAKATSEGRTLKGVILCLLVAYVAGKVDL